jgi:hypothetical protein
MKKLFALVTFATLVFGERVISSYDNFQVIREEDNVRVRKFDDGVNTCYVAQLVKTTGISISCLKR